VWDAACAPSVLTTNVAVMMTMRLMGSSIARRVSPRFALTHAAYIPLLIHGLVHLKEVLVHLPDGLVRLFDGRL
jgi:hypothetical protein